ncbi:MAG: DUF2269 family protein [Chloroflexota bacterium]
MKFLTRSGLGVLPIILIIAAILVSLPFPFLGRQWHLLMHILGAVLFIGNITVTAAWMILVVRSGQAKLVHFGARAVNQADLLFTVPGVLLIFLNGLTLAPAFGGTPWSVSWIAAALALLILSGIVWLWFLLRYQNQMVELSASGEQLSAKFMLVFRNWGIWGGIATVLPIISLVLMVFKPTLWG